MEESFDFNDARPNGKRPAATAENLGGENKRLRVGSLAEPLHLDPSWTNGDQGGCPTEINHDVCFGVVLTKAVSSMESRNEKMTALTVALLGNALKLSFQGTGKYAGLITSEPLGQLVRDFSVSLTARIHPAERQPGKKSKKVENKNRSKTNVDSLGVEVPVRVVVHGLMTEKDVVARFLSDHDLFFQHPFQGELDGSVPYFNPHYLLRPGAEMPDLGRLSLLCGSTNRTPAKVLDDVSKARLMRVFDLAYDPGESMTAKPSPRLKTTLKRHQLSALAMMTEKECGVIDDAKFPTLWEKLTEDNACYRHRITGSKEDRPWRQSGGLLADEMGLGKTLSVLALICWSLDSSNLAKNGDQAETDAPPHATLVVAPKSTLPGWQEQIKRHVRKDQLEASVFHSSNRGKESRMMHRRDVVFTTYETLRSDWQGQRLLYSKPWLRVILDEAHHIRTRSTQVFQAACAINAEFRWCLTGTPIHNSLDDYGALVSFIGVRPFSIKSVFDSWIVSPLKRKYPGSMRNLEDLVKATCLRRTKTQVEDHLPLPPRLDRVEWIDLSPPDRELYEYFKAKTASVASGMATQRGYRKKEDNIICLINILRRICGHGEMLLPESALRAWRERQNDSIDWQTMQKWYGKQCDLCGQDAAAGDESSSASPDARFLCRHVLCPDCSMEREEEDEEERSDTTACPVCRAGPVKATALSETPAGVELQRRPVMSSNKILALVRNICKEQRSQPGDSVAKSVIFSSWTKMLDLAQHALEEAGFSVARIDGQKGLLERARAISRFGEDPGCTVMLATIGSAGEGIDLTPANCVHLLEPHWSPMAEAQAVDRVHRIGQSRPVKATRYVTRESVETVSPRPSPQLPYSLPSLTGE
ncbi:SNF2 family N-terminal domain-containing protein [Chaetomium sp. MPI-SDFR-AT-0129]|nr:SNF2 family N-terminal domain-containing protein [Chaetomium sp. MPI-SDFR-AT-0129]